jgi:hypothetical protein
MMLTVCLRDIKNKKINPQYSKSHMTKLPILSLNGTTRVVKGFKWSIGLYCELCYVICFCINMRISLIKEAFTE